MAVSYGYRDAATLGADLVVDSLVDLFAVLKKSAGPHANVRM